MLLLGISGLLSPYWRSLFAPDIAFDILLISKSTIRLSLFLKYLDLSTDEHKRHYIAETQNQEFILPTTQIVRTIAHAFSTLSSRMQTIVKQRDMLELQKQYLLRQMFI